MNTVFYCGKEILLTMEDTREHAIGDILMLSKDPKYNHTTELWDDGEPEDTYKVMDIKYTRAVKNGAPISRSIECEWHNSKYAWDFIK